MSFATRALTSLLQNVNKKLTIREGISSVRQFHAMIRPLPKSISEVPSLTQNPIDNSLVSPTSLIAGLQRLLVPVSSLVNQVSGFKVKGRLKRRCKDCYFVIRQQRHYVICPTHPRHKQMSMKKKDYKSWILTHATQSKIRPY